MNVDFLNSQIDFDCVYYGNRIAHFAKIDGEMFSYDRVAMSDNGQIDFWNEKESFSVQTVYGDEDDDGNFPVIGYKYI